MQFVEPIIRKKYPHMGKYDARVWRSFLLQYPGKFNQVAYDVRVGKPVKPAGPVEPEFKKCLAMLTMKRIDVVGMNYQGYWVIEIKDIVDISSPGQALAYATLLKDELPQTRAIIPCLVFALETPGVVDLARKLGVRTYRTWGQTDPYEL